MEAIPHAIQNTQQMELLDSSKELHYIYKQAANSPDNTWTLTLNRGESLFSLQVPVYNTYVNNKPKSINKVNLIAVLLLKHLFHQSSSINLDSHSGLGI